MARQVLIIEDTPDSQDGSDINVDLIHDGTLDAPFEERTLSSLVAQYLYQHIDTFSHSAQEGNDDPTDVIYEDDECDE
jgi:hypothetical protein